LVRATGALCGCCGGVKTTNISHQEKDGLPVFPHFNQRSGSAVAAQWKRSGSAADAQQPGGLKPLYSLHLSSSPRARQASIVFRDFCFSDFPQIV
jgi:hypothetical protein